MEKKTVVWTIKQLRRDFITINFPEYQREPNVWLRSAKQLLIDSILRRFDIASLYFYEDEKEGLSCIDGRQRINAIMSFFNENPEDTSDNGYRLKISNEIVTDDDNQFRELDNLSWQEIENEADNKRDSAKIALERILQYELTIVKLSKSAKPTEFNLQFTRLNLGTSINAGEKLHAMVGDMRNLCFDSYKIGKHPFLETLSIPTRRFAKEQVAAQLIAQVFSMRSKGEFTRVRHVDLQRFFKLNFEISTQSRPWIDELEETFDALGKYLPDAGMFLRNRAISVSVVLFAWKNRLYNNPEILKSYAGFVRAFLSRLRWQLGKGILMDKEYHDLLTFQRHVTQAAVEKPAVKGRHETFEKQFRIWSETGRIDGDAEFQERTSENPDKLSGKLQ